MRGLIIAALFCLPSISQADHKQWCPHCQTYHIVKTSPVKSASQPRSAKASQDTTLQTLPYARRFINGRYYGSLGDRFYGPQYGNF